MSHKIKESLAFFSAIALLAVVAGAENYNAEMGSEPWNTRTVQRSKFYTKKFDCKIITLDSVRSEVAQRGLDR
jgi:hypothetical protein